MENNLKNYSVWGNRELVEELMKRDREQAKLQEKCKLCGDPMNGIVKIHHHFEECAGGCKSIMGADLMAKDGKFYCKGCFSKLTILK